MGYALAKTYDMEGTPGGVLSLGAFLMTTYPQVGNAVEGESLGNVVAMTRFGKNPVSKLSDYQLSLGETMSSVSAVNSYIYAELVLVDLIFIKLAEKSDLIEQITTWEY